MSDHWISLSVNDLRIISHWTMRQIRQHREELGTDGVSPSESAAPLIHGLLGRSPQKEIERSLIRDHTH
jgi:hypothetical protein